METMKDEEFIDFSKSSFVENLKWINDHELIFNRQDSDNKSRLYKLSIKTKEIAPILYSTWNNNNPSPSPDGHKLAFLSNRSGKWQVWLYDYTNKSHKQITGYAEDEFVNNYMINIEWIDNSTICFPLSNAEIVKVNI